MFELHCKKLLVSFICNLHVVFHLSGITDMLDQIWHEDQKVRDAVVYAYKEFYFKPNNDSERLDKVEYGVFIF